MKRHRYFIAQVPFDFLQPSDVLAAVSSRLPERPLVVSLVNPHSVMTSRRRSDFRRAITASDLVLPEGVGVTLAARLLRIPCQGRVPGPSLVRYLCDAGRRIGLRHYFYGGGPEAARKMAESLEARFPGLDVCGVHSPPYFEQAHASEAEECERINQTGPDVIWVGLGAPKQELWMARNVHRLRARAMFGVGAAFDFESGNVRRAPDWVQRSGMEWLYRLSREPRRLWRRNVDSPVFLWKAVLEGSHHQRASVETYPLVRQSP